MKYTMEETADAKFRLMGLLKPSQKVYTILRQVSRSGMSRHISILVRSPEDEMIEISGLVGRVLGEKRNMDDGGLVVSGCGMDMGFEVVYNLGRALYPNGYDCTGDNCHSNDHFNGDRNYTPHLHKDGGYAFRHSWL